MRKYGIELEFFVYHGKEIVPAYKFTNLLDGNPVVGEIKTGIFDSKIDVVFDLKKRIYLLQESLASRGCRALFIPEVRVDLNFRRNLRKDRSYINAKDLEVLEEFSVYPDGALSKEVDAQGVFRASLQVNISENETIGHDYVDKDNKDRKFSRNVSSLFNYYPVIQKLDKLFEQEIKTADRVPGVYALKTGDLGTRVEYRSLPNSVHLDKLLSAGW